MNMEKVLHPEKLEMKWIHSYLKVNTPQPLYMTVAGVRGRDHVRFGLH